MERSEYSLLSLSVWFIASQIASGWFEVFAIVMASGWLVAFVIAVLNENNDQRKLEHWYRSYDRRRR